MSATPRPSRPNLLARLSARLTDARETLMHWDEPEPWDAADWGFDQPSPDER